MLNLYLNITLTSSTKRKPLVLLILVGFFLFFSFLPFLKLQLYFVGISNKVKTFTYSCFTYFWPHAHTHFAFQLHKHALNWSISTLFMHKYSYLLLHQTICFREMGNKEYVYECIYWNGQTYFSQQNGCYPNTYLQSRRRSQVPELVPFVSPNKESKK